MKKITYLLLLCLTIFSCEEILLEDDILDAVVRLVAPVDNAQFASTGITFTWEPVENGTQYQIQIARPSFSEPLQIVTDNTTDTTSFTTQLNVGQYEWRVRAVNSGYASAYTTRKITVVSNEDFQSNSVTLSSPSNDIITNTASQNLAWQPVLGATGYQLQVINTATSTVTFEQEVTATNYAYTFPEGNYQWKVRATNGSQNTLYSARSLLVDTTAPTKPVPTSPANLSNTSDNTISFQWTRTPLAGSVETDSIYIYTNQNLTTLQYKNREASPYVTSSLTEGTYYWFIKSFDAAGNISQQSTVFSFTLN